MSSSSFQQLKLNTLPLGNIPGDLKFRAIITDAIRWAVVIVFVLLLFDVTRPATASDVSVYDEEKKTVLTRPAMRLGRVQLPRPIINGRRRIYTYRRPPILMHRRPGSTSPGYRRRIPTTNDGDSDANGRTNPIQATVQSGITQGRMRNITSQPVSTSSVKIVAEEDAKSIATSASGTITPTSGELEGTSASKKTLKDRNPSLVQAIRRANKDIQYPDLLKKLDYFMSYYPTVREAASRLGVMLTKYEHTSREERRRIWKGVFRVKSDLRNLRGKCDGIYRNVTGIMVQVRRQANELSSYEKSAKKKIDQIETHQGSQDLQYFELYERTNNNSKDVQRLQEEMAVLLPLVTGMARNQVQNTLFEKRALKQMDSHARDNIADMTNQILIQQNTLSNLGNQVRAEMNQLHTEKQSMAKTMDQHTRKLTDKVNLHMASHLKQLSKFDTSMHRQAETIKYITTIVENHDDLLHSKDILRQSYIDEMLDMGRGLVDMRKNISRMFEDNKRTRDNLNVTDELLKRLDNETQGFRISLVDQHGILRETVERLDNAQTTIKTVSDELGGYKEKQEDQIVKMDENINQLMKQQKIHANNLTAIIHNRESHKFVSAPQYPSDEPAPDSTSVTPQELMTLLSEIGVEDRMSRLTRVLRHQQQRMSNVTRAVLRIAEDNEAIASSTSHYFSLINSQAKIIRDQNQTIGRLAVIAATQGETINSLSTELANGQQTVFKLTNIISSLASRLKSPMGSQRDCHDVWLNGNRRNGVYNVIESMNLRPVYCNLTEYGGWTVIQRRKDGSQYFDKNMKDYKHGFGDIYGEYWLGLETIKQLTQEVRSSVALQVILEDWEGNSRQATYSRFYLYGTGYNIAISGYSGDAGDSLSSVNGRHFSAKRENSQDWSTNSCPYSRKAGWWFASVHGDCGESNLNGPYHHGAKTTDQTISSIHWKKWHGIGYPLKSVTMQIIPSNVIIAHQNSPQKEKVPDNIDGDVANDLSVPEIAPPGSTSYETDLQDAGINGMGRNPDYDNIDYNMLLADG